MNENAHIEATLSALKIALDEMTAPHVPQGEELKHLERALYHLICARDTRDFTPGEEAVWDCGNIKIAGVDRGGWKICLLPAQVDRSPEGQDGETRLDRNDESAVRNSECAPKDRS
jgi:hypothetical protein